jgi:hypothetical protein
MAFVAGPVLGVRVAGIAVEYLEAIRFSRTWARVDEVVQMSEVVREEGRRLADTLHPIIGALGDTTLRPRLVALRRDLFQARLSSPRIWSYEARTALPNDVTTAIRQWREQHERLAAREMSLEALLADETAERTAALRSAVAAYAFRQGVAQSSASLSADLDRWLAAPQGTTPENRTTLRLTKYLARAVMKTSPYATFTASGIGDWSESATSPSFTSRLRVAEVIEVDRASLNALWYSLTAEPGPRDAAELRVNPSVVEDQDVIWFLGSGPTEPLQCVLLRPGIRRLLAAVTAGRQTRADVIDQVTGDGSDLQAQEQAGRFLDALIDCGLVERCRPYPDQSPDAVGEFVQWLEKNQADHRFVPLLRELRQSLETRTPSERIRRRRHAVQDSPEPADETGDILHTNALLRGPTVTLPRQALQAICEDLSIVRDLFALFDASLSAKIALADLFREHYGESRRLPFMHFYRDLHEPTRLAGHPAVQTFVHNRQPSSPRQAYGQRSEALDELRRRTWDWLNTCSRRTIPPSAVREMTAHWPPFIRSGLPVSCYGQLVGGPNGLLFVSNMMINGTRVGIGRIQHLLGSPSPEHVPHPELAEFRTGGNSNVNLRPKVLQAIDYPFLTDAEADLRLGDLQVGYEHTSGLLCLYDPAGSVVRPVHQGQLNPAFLPPAQRFMISIFGAQPIAMSSGWALRGRGVPPTGKEEIAHTPRLTIGSVVVARAQWRMRAAVFPVPDKGERDTAYLLRIARWSRQHQVPRRFFARVLDPHDRRSGADDKSHKPMFVDVTNWFLLKSFVRSLRHPGRTLILEEPLPEVSDAPRYGTHGNHVTEYILDLPGRST